MEMASERVVKRGRITTVSLVVLCQSFQALGMGGIALLLPIIRKDLGLTFTQGGSLAAATSLVYALMQIPSGYLSDRFSPKRLFVIGTLGSTILALTFGLVTAYWQALINQTISGFFRALLFAPGLVLLTAWFPPHRRATAMGLFLIGGFSGSLIFNLAGPLIVARFDWRLAFISIASLGIIAALTLLRFGKEAPSGVKKQKTNILDTLQLFRSRVMWVCGAIQYIRLGVVQGITFWLPSFLIDGRGLPLQMTGLIIAIQAIIIAPSNVLGGYVSDRLRNPNLVIGVSVAVLGITAWLFATVSNMVLLLVLIGINAIFLQMYFGPLFAIPVEILGAGRAGMSSGFSNFFANLGGLSFTYLLGTLRDATGSFESGFYAIAGACAISFVLNFMLAQMRRRAVVPTTSS